MSAAHARPRDVVDRDVVRLEPLEDADVGQAVGAPAFERDADRGPAARGGGRVGRRGRRGRRHREEERDQP